jgi:hypothetical protein
MQMLNKAAPPKLLSSDDYKWTWFFAMLLLGLLPAIINGYPFYFEDSAGYDGHGLFLPSTGKRFQLNSDIPEAISSIIFPLFDVWSLAIINSITFAYTIARFATLFLPNTPLAVGIILVVLSGGPFYVSLLAPDIWIVFLGLCVATMLPRFSWADFAIAVMACSGHGSGIYILAASTAGFLLLGRNKGRLVIIAAAIGGCSIAVVLAADIYYNGGISTERAAQATLASKIMNDVPEALVDYCGERPKEKICSLRNRIDTLAPHSYDDAQYMWYAKLREEPGALSWQEFNQLGIQLFEFVLFSRHVIPYVIESFDDYTRFFSMDRCIGFTGFVEDAHIDWTLEHIAKGDKNSLARTDLLSDTKFCLLVYVPTFTVFLVGILVFIWCLFHRTAKNYDIILILYLMAGSNDIFFALFSGGYTRYHLKTLTLVAMGILVAFDSYFGYWRQRLTKQAGVISDGKSRSNVMKRLPGG